jgi:hypothetical protein
MMRTPGLAGAALAAIAVTLTACGYPAYRYSGDKSPGQANGNGLKGEWHVIKTG